MSALSSSYDPRSGSVVSSRPISLSKAAAVFTRFAANENAARRVVAAFVHRAGAAFDKLVLFHREICAARRRSELEKSLIEERDEEDERKKKKKKRSRDEAEAGDDKPQRAQSNGDIGKMASITKMQ